MQQAYDAGDLKYLVYTPGNFNTNQTQTWPLILFLHGSGERGDDPQKIKKYCLPRELESRADFPFVVLSPLCPANHRWIDMADPVMRLLSEITQRYEVDTRRIYLSGFSMGGEGAWYFAAQHPDQFAAVAPVSGQIPDVPNFLETMCTLKNTPVWVFHGAADEMVPLANSQKLAQTLHDCGGDVQFTVYDGLKHGETSDKTYADPNLFNWFLTKTR